MPVNEHTAEMCRIIICRGEKPEDCNPPVTDVAINIGLAQCRILDGAMHAAKATLTRGSPRRVFVQDLTAALNRRRLITPKDYESFQKAGQAYMDELDEE